MTTSFIVEIAYQGEPGAYSEQAARQFLGDKPAQFRPSKTFSDALDSLNRGEVHLVALPIENSLAGTLHENLDLLLRYPELTIVGECDFRVHHCLLALPGVSKKDIRVVRSHYMAIAQCEGYLQENCLVSEVSYDTAGSAKSIAADRLDNVGAIASKRAAEVYGLNILAEGIEDDKKNYTRFLILGREGEKYVAGLRYKTSLVFSLINGPGILCRALSVFAVTNIDLTKIESRHIRTVTDALLNHTEELKEEETANRWGYVFYVDISKHLGEKGVDGALTYLQEITSFCRVLGSYAVTGKGNVTLEESGK